MEEIKQEKQKMRTSTKCAIWVTVIWLGGVAAYVLFKWDKFLTLEPNALGDFLAGTMSPLALFWLVAGYRQQGEELKLNTDALKDQHDVMEFQRDEMAAQVKLYEKMVKQAEAQVRALDRLAEETRIASRPRGGASG